MEQHIASHDDKCFEIILRVIFAASFIFAGLFYEIGCAIISICLILLLLIFKHDRLRININAASISVIVLALFYFASVIWAVDPWSALCGGIKFLPVPMFLLCLMQTESDVRFRLLSDLPVIGAAMTAASFILSLFPSLYDTFWFQRRFLGAFGYANVYACFLLVGLEALLLIDSADKHALKDIACGSILIFGIMLSGSRTVFILAVFGIIASLFIRRNLYTLRTVSCSVILGCVLSFTAEFLMNLQNAWRMLEISSEEYSLLSRLLFWKDALPVIFNHPFGLGYLGYSFSQGSFQTGVYTAEFVHNSFLQILLDVGWLPAVIAFIAVVCAFLSRHSHAALRLMLATLILHCLFDFDLAFISVYFILLCLLNFDSGKELTLKIQLPVEIVTAVCVSAFGIYAGTVSAFSHRLEYHTAFNICPWDTQSETLVMERTAYLTERTELAEDILSRNIYVASAWDTLALNAYAEEDFEAFVTYKKNAIASARYDISEYSDYFNCLNEFYEKYSEDGDTEKMNECLMEIESTGKMLDDLESCTDDLAWSMHDVPDFTMPSAYYTFLEIHC